jgi:argininosuccinate lyase
MATLWKQQAALHPTFAPLNRCLQEDWFLLPHELRLQRAHAEALLSAGILSATEHAALVAALAQVERECAGMPCPHDPAEDLHTWVEARLTALTGTAGRKIHTARSRNDQVATLLKLYAIAAGEQLAEDLAELIRVAGRRATEWADWLFPLHTHQQFAAPGSVGFWVLRYATSAARVRRQLLWHVAEWRRYCPLGSAAVAGSSIPIERDIQARELGFAEPTANALDATSTRDECLELLAVATRAALHLQSLATDIILFSQTSLGWTRYPAAFATGSSMMPNKVNPDAMELLRGECNALGAAHAHAVAILKGLPSGYNRDLQCLKPIVRDAATKLHELLRLATAFLEQLDFDRDRLAAATQQGNICATLRMEQQVLAGRPLREAHHAVAAELADTGAEGLPDPLSRYRTSGSTNPQEVQRVAAALLAELERPGQP